MTLILEAYDYVADTLDAAGIAVVVDPRNIQPPCAIVDPPTVTVISADLLQCDFPTTVVAPPPGNRDAVGYLLAAADTILQALLVTNGQPATYTVNGTDLPAYTLTVRVTVQRTT